MRYGDFRSSRRLNGSSAHGGQYPVNRGDRDSTHRRVKRRLGAGRSKVWEGPESWNDLDIDPPDEVPFLGKTPYSPSGSEAELSSDSDTSDPMALYSDPASERAKARNRERIERANAADESILGKYLPSDPRAFFPFRVASPIDDWTHQDGWLEEVLDVAGSKELVPSPPPFS